MSGNYYGEGSVNNYYYQGSGAMLHQPVSVEDISEYGATIGVDYMKV